jgi:DNA-damage-inducible protein D
MILIIFFNFTPSLKSKNKPFYMKNQLTVFENKAIRSVEHEGEMYFSIVDIIEVLTDSPTPSKYWGKVKARLNEETLNELSPNWGKLKMKGIDGKNYATDCANTEGVFRMIMSVPSPKAEPFKVWLASLGKQAIVEAENPELLTERQAELYRAKGYSEEWIGRRVQTIETRKELTDEWKNRGVKAGDEYSILTATIAKGTFGVNPSEHSKLKGLDKQNLRDHMTPIELILTSLSEEVTRMVTVREDAQGFNENLDAAVKGGEAGKTARENVERITGEKVVSRENFLGLKGGEKSEELPE